MTTTLHCTGPKLVAKKNISKDDFVSACDKMQCRPEAIYGGGFKYIGDGYKSFQIQAYSWAIFDPLSAMTDWSGNKDILIRAGRKMSTCLIARAGAALYTNKELEDWKVVLASIGIECGELPQMPM